MHNKIKKYFQNLRTSKGTYGDCETGRKCLSFITANQSTYTDIHCMN